MATIQKTTVRRYNGVDWDSIFFSTSADIVSLGAAQSIDGTEETFAIGSNLAATDTMSTLMTKVVNRMATLDGTVIPALQAGSGVTSIDASKISGVLTRAQLPVDVSGNGIEVANESAKNALTYEEVYQGDIVKVTGGAVYLCTKSDVTAVKYMKLNDETATVAWSRITGTPTTLSGYGITDAVGTADLVDVAAGNAGKVLKIGADGKLAADITGDAQTLGGQAVSYFATATAVSALTTTVGNSGSGLVKDVADLKAAIGMGDGSSLADRIQEIEDAIGDEETPDTILYDIAQLEAGTTIAALAASKITGTLTRAQLPADISGRTHEKVSLDACYTDLTTNNAAVGDWVKLADGKLYVITDTSNLANASGYTLMVDIAGTNIAWAKITGTPTTLSGYGITDAVAKTDVAYAGGAGAANKVVGATADGKLAFDITGDAATVGGHAADYFATAQALADLSLSVPVMVESESEIVSPKVGQMVIVPVVEV